MINYLTNLIAERMDQDLREKVHNKLSPCTDDEFILERRCNSVFCIHSLEF